MLLPVNSCNVSQQLGKGNIRFIQYTRDMEIQLSEMQAFFWTSRLFADKPAMLRNPHRDRMFVTVNADS